MFTDRITELFSTRQYRFLDYLTYHKAVSTGDFTPIRAAHERKGNFSRWIPYNSGIPPYSHREILSFEVVLEWDSSNRNQNYRKAKGVHKYLKYSEHRFYLEDHNGKSPHIHIFHTDREDLSWIIERTEAYNSDLQVQGKHLIRALGGLYKDEFYSSCFKEFKDIQPVTNQKEVNFPEINLSQKF